MLTEQLSKCFVEKQITNSFTTTFGKTSSIFPFIICVAEITEHILYFVKTYSMTVLRPKYLNTSRIGAKLLTIVVNDEVIFHFKKNHDKISRIS